jgi:hypothetical protein
MAQNKGFGDQVLFTPQTRAQGFTMPSAPDLMTPLRQSQNAMLQEQKSVAAVQKLDLNRQAEILKANKFVEDIGAKNLLALTTGGKKFLEAGVEAFGKYQESEAAAIFMEDVEAQQLARAQYLQEQAELSVLDNEGEKLALQAQRDNAPHEVVSRYNQLWGRGRRAYEEKAAEYYGNAETYRDFFDDKVQSDEIIELPNGQQIALNKPNKTNAEFAAVRAAVKDMYVQENGLQAIINNNPGLMADKFLPGVTKAERKITSEYEKLKADNDSFQTRQVELNTLVRNAETDPLALSHYLNIVSTSTKEGKALGMRGAWNQLETDLLQVAASGKDITRLVEVLKSRVMPNDPKSRTYGFMHGTKLDVIAAKALDEERKIYRRDEDLARRDLKDDYNNIISQLPEDAGKDEILAAKEAFTKVAHSKGIYDANMSMFDRLLANPAINGDLERQNVIINSHKQLEQQGLLTVAEVQKFPGIKGYNQFLQTAIRQEQAYNQNGGLKETLTAVERQVKQNKNVKLYGKLGELGGTASMMAGDYKRQVAARVQQLMMDPNMTVERANEQAFQEFTIKLEADMANPDHKYYYANKKGQPIGFVNYNNDVATNRKLYNARLASIAQAQKDDPQNFLSEEGLIGDEVFWTKAMRGFGEPGWRPDSNLVQLARHLGVPVLDIYKNQLINYPDLPQPPVFDQMLQGDNKLDPEYSRFLNNYVSETASRAQFSRFTGRPPVRSSIAGLVGDNQVGRLKRAFIIQESNGNHNAVNSRTGALGLVQVMPENVGPMTQQYLGRTMTYAEFKNNRAAQELLATRMFEDLLAQHSAPGRSEEEVIRRVAAHHYGGPGAVEYWNSHQYHAKGSRFNPYGAEPDMAEYTMSVYRRYMGDK